MRRPTRGTVELRRIDQLGHSHSLAEPGPIVNRIEAAENETLPVFREVMVDQRTVGAFPRDRLWMLAFTECRLDMRSIRPCSAGHDRCAYFPVHPRTVALFRREHELAESTTRAA